MSGQVCKGIHPLTGLYDNRTFVQAVNNRLLELEPNMYCMVAIDVEHFRLFNKIYGREEGNRLLEHVADCLKNILLECDAIAGYMGGDNFAIMLPNQSELLTELQMNISNGIKKISNTVGFMPFFGVYCIDDVTLTAEALYDRATIALSHAEGSYKNRIYYYQDSMTDEVEKEINLLSDIQNAMDNQEFTFYAQPQCDISTGKIVGAESLVRWCHHSKGLISPGVFIPVLEKNGFIADLDRYTWDKVCAWIRSWLDRGYHPVPISINVSRIDIFSMDVPGYLKQLMRKYGLQPNMLKIEITESAYAEDNDDIKKTVKQLQDAGFLVMMDDFGSGYSSLNMLKDVSVDVLKIDMRFLDMEEHEAKKGIGILESIVNMSLQMGVPIIVEGVETKQQEDFLLGMGCRYTQGYYYYKPLPINEFEQILTDEDKLDFDGLWCKKIEPLHVREFLDMNLFTDTMLNNLLGANVFYDIYDNKVDITRVNDQFYRLMGISSEDEADYSYDFWSRVPEAERIKLFSIFEQAYENPVNGANGYVHFHKIDGKLIWIYLRVFYLRERDGHKLFYGSLMDMTFLKEEKHRNDLTKQTVTDLPNDQKTQLEAYYGDMPCGYGVAKVILDEEGEPADYQLVYVNREMERVCGNDIKRLKHMALKLFSDDKKDMLDKAYQAAYLGETVEQYAYSSLNTRYWQLTFYQYEYGYVSCMLRDITYNQIRENVLQSVMSSYREIYFIDLQDNQYRMIYPEEAHMLDRGNYEKHIERHYETDKILRYDEENVRKFLSIENLKSELATKDTIEYKYRRRFEDNKAEWCLNSVCVSERIDGEPKTVVMMLRSIDALMKEEEKQRRNNMAEFLADTTDGFFIYRAEGDERILYANKQVLNIYGCDNIHEFRELVGNSFKGMVHPDDLERAEKEITEQLRSSDANDDYIEYRIIRKDGEVRWVSDCGHLDDSEENNQLFYVFISDVTDRMH